MIAKYFEKIGDHAVNISQWVLFMITGAHEEDTVHDLLRGGRS
jgi:phosphate transport system protein